MLRINSRIVNLPNKWQKFKIVFYILSPVIYIYIGIYDL